MLPKRDSTVNQGGVGNLHLIVDCGMSIVDCKRHDSTFDILNSAAATERGHTLAGQEPLPPLPFAAERATLLLDLNLTGIGR